MTSVVDVTTNRHVINMLSWLHSRHVRGVAAAEKETSDVKYLPSFLM
jgi:hypothetical protein